MLARLVLVLIATTGLRRGEALAPRLGSRRPHQRRAEGGGHARPHRHRTNDHRTEVTTITAHGAPLPCHRVGAQGATRSPAVERLHAGDQWTDSGLVFTTEFGGPVDPRNVLRTIEIAADKAGVEHVGVHTLRHSAAVAWLEAGVHIKAVADLLGSISITGDIYRHTSDATTRAAIDGLTSILGL